MASKQLVPHAVRGSARRLAAWAERSLARRPAGRQSIPPEVTFLVWNAFSMGGTVRTVLRQAGALSRRGLRVTVVSVTRHRSQATPFFPVPAGVRHEVLVDRRELTGSGRRRAVLRWLDTRPARSRQFCLGREGQASLLTDLLLVRRVLAARGVVVGTRIGLNTAIARFGHPAALKVAQEHLQLARYPLEVRRAIARLFPRLDVVACLTEGEAADYRRHLGTDGGPRIVVVPNAIDDRLPPAADPLRPRIVAVGRLAGGKAFHLLVEAFARIAPAHPQWTLRIVGAGPARARIEEAVAAHDLADRVELVGRVDDVDRELADASVFAMTSRFEAFGIVLLEAMAAGLAIVSFAAPRGPRELLTHGRNALLAEPGDVAGLAEQLDRALADDDLRRRLGSAGREDVHAFRLAAVTDRWLEVFGWEASPDASEAPVAVHAGR